MNILVTGASGQLGNCIRQASASSSHNFIFTDVIGEGIIKLDITDPAAVEKFISDTKTDVIVNCAAYTNVDKAEDDYEMAEKLNATAVANLAKAAGMRGATLIHISTDYVFGGNSGNTPRAEEEEINPTGVYGLTKLHGEEAIKGSGCKHLIIRTAWLYSEHGKNFVKTMLALTAEKPRLSVVFDQAGTPTYAPDLANAILHIIEDKKYQGREGTYHFSNEGVCSWYDFAKMIAEYAGNHACDIRPCHSNEFPSKVKRPNYSVLDKSKIKDTFGVNVPYWTDSLKLCINNLRR